MKKNILKDIENIKEKRKLSKEAEKQIMSKVIANWAIGTSMVILVMIFVIAAKFLSQTSAILIYNIYSVVLLIFTLIIFEMAYKKDNGNLAISGIEILFVSIFTLFSPYIFFKFSYGAIYGVMTVFAVYYIAKIINIYCSKKKKYLLEISDITDIIKKESKDELAKEFENKRQEEKEARLKKEANKVKQTAKKTKTTANKKKAKAATKRNTNKSSTTKKSTVKKTTTREKTTKNKENK